MSGRADRFTTGVELPDGADCAPLFLERFGDELQCGFHAFQKLAARRFPFSAGRASHRLVRASGYLDSPADTALGAQQ